MSISQLERLACPPGTPVSQSISPVTTSTSQESDSESITRHAKEIVKELGEVIPREDSPERMTELIDFCDRLNTLLAQSAASPGRPSKLQIQGLGLTLPDHHMPTNCNGHALRSESQDDEDEQTPTTPRVDKGKGRAEPEPEQQEPVTSPHRLPGDSEDEDEEIHEFPFPEGGEITSPTDRSVLPSRVTLEPNDDIRRRSRIWVEEEGEVFRKGTILLGPDEMEGEYAGEELRKEVSFF